MSLPRSGFKNELNIINYIAFKNSFPFKTINRIYCKFLRKFKLIYSIFAIHDLKFLIESLGALLSLETSF